MSYRAVRDITGEEARVLTISLSSCQMLILSYHSRIRLVRLFKGESEVAVEQKGEPLGPYLEAEQQTEETPAEGEVVMEE